MASFEHSHCPKGCEHPQPVKVADGRTLCMRCLCKFGIESETIPCTAETCDDEDFMVSEKPATA